MQQTSAKKNIADFPEILTVEEVAAYLNLNRKTIYEAVSRNEIPHVKIGRCIRFSRESVLGWLGYGKGCVSHSSERS